MDLRSRALLVSLKISAWGGQRVDRTATKEVVENHSMSRDAGRFTKNLISPAALRPIQAASGRIRTLFCHHTLPWTDTGQRILSTIGFFPFTEKMTEAIADWRKAKEEFVQGYADFTERSKARLGDLWLEHEYPSISAVDGMFDVSYDILPFPASEDLRLDVSKDQMEVLRADVEGRIKRDVGKAVGSVVDRIRHTCLDTVERLSSFSKEEGRTFRNTVITNIRDLVDVLPSLNLVNDPRIAAATEELRQLAAIDPEDLRNNDNLRASTIAKAKEIAG